MNLTDKKCKENIEILERKGSTNSNDVLRSFPLNIHSG